MSTGASGRRRREREPPEPGLTGSRIVRGLDAELRRQGWWFDAREADRVCTFLETFCRLSDGEWAGQPLLLRPDQRAWVRRLFGWRRPDGTRRYRRSHRWLPRKNGKSTEQAGIGIFLTLGDNEPGAQVYAAAANKEQSRYVFEPAKFMVTLSPALSTAFEIFKSSLYCPALGSRFEAISSKPSTKHGGSPHAVIIDEIHAHTSDELYNVLTSGFGARRQPMEIVISTAGDDIGHFSYELWEYAQKCIQGIIEDPEFLPVIWCADEDDDWRLESTWRKANPGFGISPKAASFETEIAKIQGIPSRESQFKQTRLNIWAQSTKAALDIGKWRQCLARQRLRLEDYANRECFAGLDLSKTTDLTALALVFPNDPPEDGGPFKGPEYDVIVYFWCPAENAELRAKRDRVQYPLWIRQGYIRPTPGDVVDLRRIRHDVAEILSGVRLQELAFDPYRAAALAQELQDEEGMPVLEFRQSYTNFTGACEDLQRLHVSRGLLIDPNPVLTWQASNVAYRYGPSQNAMPDKEKSRERIDGVVALLMALGRASVRRQGRSVYEERGIEVL